MSTVLRPRAGAPEDDPGARSFTDVFSRHPVLAAGLAYLIVIPLAGR